MGLRKDEEAIFCENTFRLCQKVTKTSIICTDYEHEIIDVCCNCHENGPAPCSWILREGSLLALQYMEYQTRGWAVGMRTSFHTNPPAPEGWRDRDQLHYHYIIVFCYVMYPDQLQDPVICNSWYPPPLHCIVSARPLARVCQSRNDKFQSQLFTHLHIALFLGLYIAIIIIICYLVSMNQAKMSC